ncbi:MAG: Type IV secretory pathway VirB4 protein-like protein [Parcubacteria group bacterium GW2011_GWA2_39_18]|nr:MAG: Type IV secretory pathway VirB4 protein-like protein [Parcubacteria group bacterium GW2011_GWA2_39_18]
MALFSFKKNKQSLAMLPSISPDKVSLTDVVAPPALKIESKYLQLGSQFIRTIFVFNYPRYLSTNWLSPIVNMPRVFDIAMFIHPADTALVLKQLRKRVAQVQAQISEEEEKGKVRDPMLETAFSDMEDLRDSLMQAREKVFSFGLYITLYGNNVDELDKAENEIKSLMESRLVYIKDAIFTQDVGFNSTLPFGKDSLQVWTTLNSAPLSTTFPFISADLSSNSGIMYGINRHNNSIILFDRFSMENANMVVFAKSGSGKSYTAKLEVLRSLMLGTDVIIIDPENEYKYLAEAVGGTFIPISINSKYHLNPFDLPPKLPDEEQADVLRSNVINLIGLLRIMLGGLTPEEDALIDKALSETYASRDITLTSNLENIQVPLMGDLQQVLNSTQGAESMARKLERYTSGAFSGFLNQPTNVDLKNRLIVFSIRDMDAELRPIAMYVIIRFIWNAIKSETKKRLLLVDEAWLMMQNPDGASFLYGVAKRCRKYYLGLTTITQDVADFLSSPYGKPILTNSSIQLLLRQSPSSIDIISNAFNLTDEEKYLLLESDVGEGIFFAGLKHVAIKVVASYTEDQIITSDPAQLLKIEKAKQELGTGGA